MEFNHQGVQQEQSHQQEQQQEQHPFVQRRLNTSAKQQTTQVSHAIDEVVSRDNHNSKAGQTITANYWQMDLDLDYVLSTTDGGELGHIHAFPENIDMVAGLRWGQAGSW